MSCQPKGTKHCSCCWVFPPEGCIYTARFTPAILACFLSLCSYVPAIVLDRALYMRERSDGLYQPHTYYFFKISEEILLALLVSAPVAAAVWFAVQFQGSFAGEALLVFQTSLHLVFFSGSHGAQMLGFCLLSPIAPPSLLQCSGPPTS